MFCANNQRVAFSFFGIDIYWYAIFIVTGIFLGAYFAKKEFIKRGYDKDLVYDVLLACLPVSIIGARLWFVTFNLDYYINNLSEIIMIRHGGMAIQGGIVFAFVAAYFFAKKRKIKLIEIMDITFPSIALGQAIGRWGNFVNKEAYGYPTSLPWGINIDGVNVHPTFLYESIGDFLIFLFLLNYRKKKRKDGVISAIYLISYGILRFFVEGLRTDSLYFLNMRMAQLTSIVFIICGIYLLVRGKRNDQRL